MKYPLSKRLLLRITIIIVVMVALFFMYASSWQPIVNKVDMLYVGERIAAAKTFLLYRSVDPLAGKAFYLHGFFLEIGEAVLAFKLFGVSIGSFLLFDMLLIVCTYGLFMILIHKLIKNNILFILATILFLGINLRYRILNNAITLLYLMYLYYVLNRRWPTYVDLTKLSLLVLINFAYTVEFAYYLAGLHIVLIIIIIAINVKKKSPRLSGWWILFLLGLIGFFFALLLQPGWREYLYRIFFITPFLPPFIFKPHLPSLSLKTFTPYYSPLLLTFINGFLLYELRGKKRMWLFFACIYFLGLLNLYGIYVRADTNTVFFDILNVGYFIHYQFLVSFIILDKYLSKKDRVNTIVVFGALLLYIGLPFIDKKHLSPFHNVPKLLNFAVNLPRVSDEAWMRPEANQVAKFIRKTSSLNERLYVFDNETMYYYLTERRNSTDYYVAAVAEPYTLQEETIRSLMKNPPKYIIYSSDYWTNEMENTPQKDRLSEVNKYLLKNFTNRIIIGKTTLLSK